jgi:predicted dinucleotide-utilizing enzyme
MKLNIAIIGLGRVGSILLQQMLNSEEKGISIAAVAEIAETPGKLLAREKKIKIKSLDEIINMGKKIDIIFELTGQYEVRQELRHKLMDIKNYHTVIAPETIAILICLMFTDKDLPDVHAHKGY